jgi:hypothetical protein
MLRKKFGFSMHFPIFDRVIPVEHSLQFTQFLHAQNTFAALEKVLILVLSMFSFTVSPTTITIYINLSTNLS